MPPLVCIIRLLCVRAFPPSYSTTFVFPVMVMSP